VISQREPKDRNVRNGRTATKEYRADGGSNDDVRSKTTPGSSVFASLRRDKSRRHSTSDSGVWLVVISWISGRIATRGIKPRVNRACHAEMNANGSNKPTGWIDAQRRRYNEYAGRSRVICGVGGIIWDVCKLP
jgi:hypothetical protein